MDWFEKAVSWTIAGGFILLGIYVGLLVLRIAIGVAGFMLGSSVGTIFLAIILWGFYKRHKNNFKV